MFPSLTSAQVKDIDHIMKNNFHVAPIQLMEHAGIRVAEMACVMKEEMHLGKNIVVMCGAGNNGGDAMVAARHLTNWGNRVTVFMASEEGRMSELALQQLASADAFDLEIVRYSEMNKDDILKLFEEADMLIDGLLGVGVSSAPRAPFNEIIDTANNSQTPILAIDIPSGINSDTGEVYYPFVFATKTLTLALPKAGFFHLDDNLVLGDVYLADIGIPNDAYEKVGVDVAQTFFEKEGIIKILINT